MGNARNRSADCPQIATREQRTIFRTARRFGQQVRHKIFFDPNETNEQIWCLIGTGDFAPPLSQFGGKYPAVSSRRFPRGKGGQSP
jgi:hypothetical protein